MEKHIGFTGISSSGWGIIGLMALAVGALLICALVVVLFGLDIGGIVSS